MDKNRIVLPTDAGFVAEIEYMVGRGWGIRLCRRPQRPLRAAGMDVGTCLAWGYARDGEKPRFHLEDDNMPPMIVIGTFSVNLTDAAAEKWQHWIAEREVSNF